MSDIKIIIENHRATSIRKVNIGKRSYASVKYKNDVNRAQEYFFPLKHGEAVTQSTKPVNNDNRNAGVIEADNNSDSNKQCWNIAIRAIQAVRTIKDVRVTNTASAGKFKSENM